MIWDISLLQLSSFMGKFTTTTTKLIKMLYIKKIIKEEKQQK